MDIKDGSIIVSRTVKHNGNLRTLDQALQQLAYEIAQESEPVQETGLSDQLPEPVEESVSSNWGWQILAVGLVAGAAFQAKAEVTKYNDLVSENEDLKVDYAAAGSATERTTIDETYKENQDKMSTCQQNMLMYDGITALAVIWETYLLFISDASPLYTSIDSNPFIPIYAVKYSDKHRVSSLNWQWKF